jgi:hypothetical protein
MRLPLASGEVVPGVKDQHGAGFLAAAPVVAAGFGWRVALADLLDPLQQAGLIGLDLSDQVTAGVMRCLESFF